VAALAHPGRALRAVADRTGVSPARLAVQGLLLCVGLVALYVLAPELVDFFSVAPAILTLHWAWLGLMVVTHAASLVALALLFRALLPGVVSWVDVVLAQLSGNAASLAVPGGAPVGAAVAGRLLVRSGIRAGDAAAALTASSVLSTLTIAALVPIAGGLALIDAHLPPPFELAVLIATAVAVALVVGGLVLLTTDWPLRTWAALTRRVDVIFLRRAGHPLDVSVGDLRRNRRQLRERLGDNWKRALAYATANWLLDFGTLALALAAVGADISLGVALVAFVSAAVLRMIPITPGGLGFVEGGLASVLTIAGLAALGALVVALAYRAVTLWLSLPVGAVAYVTHRHRHPASART
jgi:uncharacterized protein (TIRG00374 family)